MEADGTLSGELFQLAKGKSNCALVKSIDAVASPPVELSALRVFGLLRSNDHELAFVHLADLFAQFSQCGEHEGLYRWVRADRPNRMSLNDLTGAIAEFYQVWNAKAFWRLVTQKVFGQELEFIAAVLNDDFGGFRLLVAVADAHKLMGERQSALSIYTSMCRVHNTAELRHNIYTLAVEVQPARIPELVNEFGG